MHNTKFLKMKNNKLTSIGVVLLTIFSAMGVYNYTNTLPKSDTKKYATRSLDRPLYITFHHTATKGQTIRQIAKGHLHRGFPEIGYHFAIGWDGKIYQLNKIEEISWHDSGQNTNSIGVVFIGNYQEKKLPDKAYYAAKTLVDSLSRHLTIKGVRYHRMTSPTLCPGQYAIQKIKPLLR